MTEEQIDALLAKGWQISGEMMMLLPPMDSHMFTWTGIWREVDYKGSVISYPHYALRYLEEQK